MKSRFGQALLVKTQTRQLDGFKDILSLIIATPKQYDRYFNINTITKVVVRRLTG